MLISMKVTMARTMGENPENEKVGGYVDQYESGYSMNHRGKKIPKIKKLREV